MRRRKTAQATEPAHIRDAATGAQSDQWLIQRSFGVHVRSVNQSERSVEVVASTEALDAYDEVVVQDWDLSRYEANPVVLWAHNQTSFLGGKPEDTLPIGHAEDVAVRKGQLEAKIYFVDEKANPLAEKVWQGFVQKSIRAVSVGFDPSTISREMDDNREFYKLSGNTLYEISVCPMGANPEAVAKQRAKAIAQIKARALPADTPEAVTDPASAEPSDPPTTRNDDMDLKELTAALEAKTVELTKMNADLAARSAEVETAKAKTDSLTKELDVEKGKVVALNERCATLETERKSQQDRGDKLVAQLVERDLDALVGTKIAPAEKPGLAKLAALSTELYQEQLLAIKARPDMKMLGEPVVGADPNPAPATTDPSPYDGGADLDAAVQKDISSSRAA